ncbi:MAG TPA: hypothetical protein VGD40_05250 [Chryseosolibacter sp.]
MNPNRKQKKNKRNKNPLLKAAQEKVALLRKNIGAISSKIIQQENIQTKLASLTTSLNQYEESWRLPPHDFRVIRLKRQIESLKIELHKAPIERLRIQLKSATEDLTATQNEVSRETRMIAAERLIDQKKDLLRKETQFDIPKSSGRIQDIPKTIRPSWENVTFMDGFIRIYHKRELYEAPVSSSRSFLNKIKSYYSFKKVPLLEIEVSNGTVLLVNEELLLFNIRFLSLIGLDFDNVNHRTPTINEWTKYTKAFYKRELPYLFHTESLRRLCQFCAEDLPIIPVSELVITSKGQRQIHHSFLFPLVHEKELFVIWESEEETKASYVFATKEPYIESAQLLYEFIAGQTVNKRDSLIHSKNLRLRLGMQCRLFHNSADNWTAAVRKFC